MIVVEAVSVQGFPADVVLYVIVNEPKPEALKSIVPLLAFITPGAVMLNVPPIVPVILAIGSTPEIQYVKGL